MKNLVNLLDEEVVNLVREENVEYFAELISRYQDKLLRYSGNILNDDQKAQDAVQESFIKAFINLNSFNVNKKFSSWIYRIVHNETMNLISKYKKQIALDENVDIENGINIEEEMIKKEMIEHTCSCLRQLPNIYAEPLALYYLEDKKYEEISFILRLPIGTIGTRINRAKILMKKICQKIK